MTGAGFFEWAVAISMGLLLAALFLSFWRLARGPDLPDRVVALDNTTHVVLAIIAVYTIKNGRSLFFIAAVLLALIIFLGTVAIAKYIEETVL